MISDFLRKLLAKAKRLEVSDEEREAQRQSFAYGNTKMANDDITREMVTEQTKLLEREGADESRNKQI